MKVWIALVLLAGCAAPSGPLDEDPHATKKAPLIEIAKNGPDHYLYIVDVAPNVAWSDLNTKGCSEPNKKWVEPEDQLMQCKNMVRIVHTPTGQLVYTTQF